MSFNTALRTALQAVCGEDCGSQDKQALLGSKVGPQICPGNKAKLRSRGSGGAGIRGRRLTPLKPQGASQPSPGEKPEPTNPIWWSQDTRGCFHLNELK